ncbi:hypothetical protein L6164_028381 [Bauhinia variegata]|uniref:Uncharacterized protein n=1 Tax=Bauhinia variegata TaxID=167791 RepID=A0ACB9L603_BAUVA|nr:hypothetical protein L6164_028381 [Bauhinia variegata]
MASMTMTASFLGGASSTITKHPSSSTSRRSNMIVAKASRGSETEKVESNSGRRDLVFAAAAAAACSIAKVSMAEEEPKRGTPEAKKKYAVVCVSMPTARVCRN